MHLKTSIQQQPRVVFSMIQLFIGRFFKKIRDRYKKFKKNELLSLVWLFVFFFNNILFFLYSLSVIIFEENTSDRKNNLLELNLFLLLICLINAFSSLKLRHQLEELFSIIIIQTKNKKNNKSYAQNHSNELKTDATNKFEPSQDKNKKDVIQWGNPISQDAVSMIFVKLRIMISFFLHI